MRDPDPVKELQTATEAPDDPFALFERWMEDAVAREINDPNAMTLATVDADGQPSARIVLLKHVDPGGFVFYTNRHSRKGRALEANPRAALCFHWKTLRRSVRLEGHTAFVDDKESDAYYASRGFGSRIGAWASRQSQPLQSRKELACRVNSLMEEYRDQPDIPRPPHWGGYRVAPKRIEFWHDGADRLHTRLLYTRNGAGWEKSLLFP